MSQLVEPETDSPARLLELVGADPERALALADRLVRERRGSREPDDVRLVVAAHRTAGLALRGLGRPAEGEARVRRGIALAERDGLVEVAAEARVTLAFVLLELGRVRAALTATDLALASLRGAPAARARATRALVLQRAGRPREAFAEYDAALKVLRQLGDLDWEARALHNRALLSVEFGDTASAIADLERSRSYSLEHGQLVDATDALHNIGVATEVAGDVPRALAIFDQADAEWTAEGVERPQRWLARVDAYLAVGLASEAATNARAAAEWLGARQWAGSEAHARFMLARCLLAQGDAHVEDAEAEAVRARRTFRAQQRGDFEPLADYLVLLCRLRRGPDARDIARAANLAEALREGGFDLEAADLRYVAGSTALAQGRVSKAQLLLGPLTAQERAPRLEIRALAWYARALLALSAGDDASADASLRTAWRRVEDQRRTLGAAEFRAATAAHVAAVVGTGLTMALRRASAADAFAWSERGRSSALRLSPAWSSLDPQLAESLSRLRWAARALDDARNDGEPSAPLASAVARAEAEVVRLSRTLHPTSAADSTLPRPADVRRLLDRGAFVELLETEGRLVAVVLGPSQNQLVELGAVGTARDHAEALAFALRRTLAGFGSPAGRTAAAAELARAAARLSAQVVEPLDAQLAGAARIIVSPSAGLVGVPWHLLPGLTTVPVSVAPSAAIWCKAVQRRRTSTGVVSVHGPGLPAAAQEIQQIAALYGAGEVTTLTGDDARCEAVLSAASRCSLLHVAAHGRLRRDNPSFSSLQLSDGPLTAYDLESLSPGPRTVVLSACDAGAGRTVVGEETFGLAWTLLGSGVSSVVAPLLPVPDDASRDVMIALHSHLARGLGASTALAAVRASLGPDDPRSVVAAAYTAFGA